MGATPGPKDCINAAMTCAKTDKAKKCLTSLVQIKEMEHNPPAELVKCLTEKAGVQAMDWKHSGKACEIGKCVVGRMAAPEAKCFFNCFFTKGCECKSEVNGCKALEEEFEEEYTVADAFHSFFNF